MPELDDRLRLYLNDRDDDKKAGRTLLHLFDALGDLHAIQLDHGRRISKLEMRKVTGNPPSQLVNVAAPNDEDDTGLHNFKTGPLADAIRATEFMATGWKVLVALAVLGAAFATIYSAVKH